MAKLDNIPDIETVKATGVVMQMPMRIGLPEDKELWTLPYEPLVSVRGANIIVRRAIAKKKGIGSVKELWTQDDWQVGVIGVFINDDVTALPEADIARLNKLLTAKKPLIVQCQLLDVLGIGMLAIEQWEYPPTKGIQNQNYQFSGFSDYNFELF